MARIGQQVCGVTLVLGLMACDGPPARSKPWRHPQKDASTAVSAPIRPLVTEAREAREARRGRQQLIVALGADPGALDPLRSPSASALWLTSRTVFESLVAVDGDRVTPELAERFDVSADGLTLDFTLRDRVTFHDGRPLEAADVKFSIDSVRAGRGHLRHELADVASVEAIDPRRVRVRLRRQNGYVLRVLAEVAIASQASYFKVSGRRANRRPAGTGPYAIAEGGQRLERFDGYWRSPKARAPAIEIRVIADRSEAIGQAQLGDIDVVVDLDPGVDVDSPVLQTIELHPARFRYLIFNGKRELFSDAEVRRAVSLAVDRKRLVSDGHRGAAAAISSPVWPGGPVSAPSPPIGRPDMRAATQLLEAAGWVQKSSRVRERDDEKLLAKVVTGETPDPARDLIFDQMRSAGFVLDVRELSPAALERALERGAFDAAVVEWSGHPDWDLTPILGSDGADNLGHLGSPAIDAALEALRGSASRAGRVKLAPKLVRALEQSVPVVFLTAVRPRVAIGDRVTGARAGAPSLSLVELARESDR